MDNSEITKQLNRIFTIDGLGKPKKAKLMLDILESIDFNEETDRDRLFEAIKEISLRKFL